MITNYISNVLKNWKKLYDPKPAFLNRLEFGQVLLRFDIQNLSDLCIKRVIDR